MRENLEKLGGQPPPPCHPPSDGPVDAILYKFVFLSVFSFKPLCSYKLSPADYQFSASLLAPLILIPPSRSHRNQNTGTECSLLVVVSLGFSIIGFDLSPIVSLIS